MLCVLDLRKQVAIKISNVLHKLLTMVQNFLEVSTLLKALKYFTSSPK